MQTVKEVRKYQYDDKIGRFPYLNDWKRNPYTWLKARFYMEASALLVYLLLKTKIKPNTVTVLYGLAGILGGILLAIPTSKTQIIAILLFFTKGILDWSDGHLARITGQTSLTGHILDIYGAHLNSLGLQVGLGFYVAQKADLMVLYYLIPLIPFLYAANLAYFSTIIYMDFDIIKGQINKHKDKDINQSLTHNSEKLRKIKDSRLKYLILNFLDDRARSVDFICLLILIEIYTPFFITWLIFLLLILKQFSIFSGSFYAVVKVGWAEHTLHNIIGKIRRALDKEA